MSFERLGCIIPHFAANRQACLFTWCGVFALEEWVHVPWLHIYQSYKNRVSRTNRHMISSMDTTFLEQLRYETTMITPNLYMKKKPETTMITLNLYMKKKHET